MLLFVVSFDFAAAALILYFLPKLLGHTPTKSVWAYLLFFLFFTTLIAFIIYITSGITMIKFEYIEGLRN